MYGLDENKFQFKKLRSCPVFENFTNQEFQHLLNNAYRRSYKRGQVLFNEGDVRNRIYFLLNGLIRFERYDEDAVFCYFDYVKKQTLFPYGGMFSDSAYHYSAQALTDITLFYIPTEIFEQNCMENLKQMRYMYTALSKILHEHELRVQYCIFSSANERVIKTLDYLRDVLGIKNEAQDEVIPYPITLNEIAMNSGVNRETVGQVIKKLKGENKIRYQNKIFVFVHPQKIEDF